MNKCDYCGKSMLFRSHELCKSMSLLGTKLSELENFITNFKVNEERYRTTAAEEFRRLNMCSNDLTEAVRQLTNRSDRDICETAKKITQLVENALKEKYKEEW